MRSYREAQQVADALSGLGVLMRFACMWDPKAYKARQHTVAGLRKDMLLIRCASPWWQHDGCASLCCVVETSNTTGAGFVATLWVSPLAAFAAGRPKLQGQLTGLVDGMLKQSGGVCLQP